MNDKFINPPKFHKDYSVWRQEIDLWSRITGRAKAKQGVELCLTLEGKAKEIGLVIDVNELSADGGLKILLDKLDSLFLKESKEKTYEYYKAFDTVNRSNTTAMSTYIVDFDSAYTKLKKNNFKTH